MSIKNIVFSILAIAVFSSFALAQGGGRTNQPNQPNQPPRDGVGRGDRERGMGGSGFRMMRPRGGMPGMFDFNRLNLTDAQKQRIQTILDTNRQSAQNNQAQMEEMGRLMMLKRQGLLTTEQGTRLTALEAQMTSSRDKFRNDIIGVLTPEQRTLFEQMQNERGGRMRGMRDGGGMRRGPGGQNRPMGGGNPQQPPPSM